MSRKAREYVKRSVGISLEIFPHRFSAAEVYALMQGYADQEREKVMAGLLAKQNSTLRRILKITKNLHQ